MENEKGHFVTHRMEKVSLVKGFVGQKCPRCRKGAMFPAATYNLARFTEMRDECPHCGQDLTVEPGFYWGAMYVGYAINVGIILVMCAVLFLGFPEAPIWTYIVAIVTPILVTIPFNYRYGRVGMIYFFSPIKYDPKYSVPADISNLEVNFPRKASEKEEKESPQSGK